MNVRHRYGILYLFPTKSIFYDKMNLKLFYFHVTKYYSLVITRRKHRP